MEIKVCRELIKQTENLSLNRTSSHESSSRTAQNFVVSSEHVELAEGYAEIKLCLFTPLICL